MQTFSADEGSGLTYPALDDRWALLIAASKGWANYRFQADVFAMYQLLKQHGYDDDHIVLICEDDVARHTNNPHPGELRISDTGANVYDAAAIDYRLSDLTPADIGAILQGRASDCLPKVLAPDADDNVLVFWSSHGSPGSMDFGGSQSMT
jgi:glycosylphosphatidylinositol transamidase (GPIT) subunit GPI8